MELQTFREFAEAKGKETIFTFGRFNPPTIGHGKLLDKVAAESNGKYHIFASNSSDPKKNPLEYKEKIKYMRKMFPKHGRNIIEDAKVRNVFDILVKLYDEGYTKATMVVGSDRIEEFKQLTSKYNDVKARHGYYFFEEGIDVVSAGERDPDSDGVDGMSASKMRLAATENDFKQFSKGLPKVFKDGIGLFSTLRTRMGIKEADRPDTKLPSLSERRELYIKGDILKVGETVNHVDDEAEITIAERKSNYIVDTDGIKHFINNLK